MKPNASQHLIDLVDGLEETYYIADVLPEPKEFQNEAYYYALKKACKSMNDEIGKITEEKQDYQEYVESFAPVSYTHLQTKATQVSQYELVLHKDSNWKIVG